MESRVWGSLDNALSKLFCPNLPEILSQLPVPQVDGSFPVCYSLLLNVNAPGNRQRQPVWCVHTLQMTNKEKQHSIRQRLSPESALPVMRDVKTQPSVRDAVT